jgi:hypothetical protein
LNAQNPNIENVERIAVALNALRDDVILVGGCACGLLLSDAAAAPARVTYDVDLVAQVIGVAGYHQLEKQFSKLGFKRDSIAADAPICRWLFDGIEVDLMPSDPTILGFSNPWYPLAIQTAQLHTLPSGITLRVIAAPAFMATKFEPRNSSWTHVSVGFWDFLARRADDAGFTLLGEATPLGSFKIVQSHA